MITTPDLITSLAANLRPVRRLRPPAMRATCWLLLAAVVLTLLAVNQGIRPDLALKLREPAFAACMAASMLTGILAALATFMVSLPDRSRLWMLLPVPTLIVWLSDIGYQCLTQWISIGPDGVSLGEAASCFATLVLTSLPLSLTMLVMLRYSVSLRPTDVTLTGSLAVAAITATALALFHTVDASLMILMWNIGTAVILVSFGGLFSRQMFQWVAPRLDASE